MAGFKVSPECIGVEYRGKPTPGFFIQARDISTKFDGIAWSCRQISFPYLKVEVCIVNSSLNEWWCCHTSTDVPAP